MGHLFNQRLSLLKDHHLPLLKNCLHGIEREALRIDENGRLAQTPHPLQLGAALTHPLITTDYSEALLEFITEARPDAVAMFNELEDIQGFVYGVLDHELLWSASMPCILPEEQDIPIADYGSSWQGMFKHVYRKGLRARYGSAMQCIAGIHFNFSFPEQIWPVIEPEECRRDPQSCQSVGYMSLIRNFHRYSWLLMYLFGASPAVDRNFLQGRPHNLISLDKDTLYLPWATSQRMSDLSYQNKAQSSLTPCYNDLDGYIDRLCRGLSTSWPPYEKIGTHDEGGEWLQLNTHVIQVENEYYSSIRPKRVVRKGERTIRALQTRGIQYIEVRCMDIDPFMTLGIDLTTSRFLDTFLLYCLLQESPRLADQECRQETNNFLKTVTEGRCPDLKLVRDGQKVGLRDWGMTLLEEMEKAAELLDLSYGGDNYRQALLAQLAKLQDSQLTPSARVLAAMQESGDSFVEFGLRQSRIHSGTLRKKALSESTIRKFQKMSGESRTEQTILEQQNEGSFDDYVKYHAGSPC